MRALPRVVLLLVLLAALLVPLVSLQLNMCAARRVDQMVKRKKIEVDNMLKRHQSKDDPLFMRMTYMAENQFHYAKSIKKPADGPEKLHTMSVVFDLKRRSPTIPENRNVVAYENPGQFAELLTYAGVDAFFVNVDETDYGGKNSDVADVVAGVRKAKPENPPPVILKDLVIHPIQIAQAAEWGCAGVVLMTCALGADLETLLDSCTIMGVEAIVEVHTPRELEFALGCGATTFFVNLWDRMSGKYYPDQAHGLASKLPINTINVVGGNLRTIDQAGEMGLHGYEGIVLGRAAADIPDIKEFVDSVHMFRGFPRTVGTGMKGMPIA